MERPPEDQIAGFRSEIGAVAGEGGDSFFTWFNDADDVEDSFRQGAWEFSTHVAPHFADVLPTGRPGTVVEIGYGGGRLLAAAAQHFEHAIGVDVHANGDVVRDELQRRGIGNCSLHETDGASLPLDAGSVDAVFTFIVMQHIGRIALFDAYLREAARVLRPGGAAVVYFGRWGRVSTRRSAAWRYAVDRCIERVVLWRGYRERASRTNATNLLIRPGEARRRASATGFDVLGLLVSRRRRDAGPTTYGGQHGLVLRRR